MVYVRVFVNLRVKMVNVNSRVFMQAAFGKHQRAVPRFIMEGSFRSRPTQRNRPATALTATAMRQFLHVEYALDNVVVQLCVA
jgi:hypothetical protein